MALVESNLNRSRLLLICTLLLSSVSCGSQLSTGNRQGSKDLVPAFNAIDVTFTSLEGNEMNLTQLSPPRPLILMFASTTCPVCTREIREFISHLSGTGGTSQSSRKVEIMTLLVGASVEKARTYQSELKIPWTVGLDSDLRYFRKYCPEGMTPCLVVAVPNPTKITQFSGAVTISEIVGLTGEWQ